MSARPGLALLARALTLFRFAAIPPFVALLLRPASDRPGGALLLAALYVAVALSDWWDGQIARRAKATSPGWGRLDAAADIAFNAAALTAAAALGLIAPWAPIAIVVLGAGFLFRRAETEARPIEDLPGKLAGVLFYALAGIVTAEAAWPGVLGRAVVRAAGDAVALYAAGVVSARFAMSSWRRWTKRSA